MYISHLLDGVVHFKKSYPVHEMETVFFKKKKQNKNFMKWISFHERDTKI
jgi:hypothetical protein